MEVVVDAPQKVRRPGRPRAIPVHLEPIVAALYEHGYGYRAIARMLAQAEYGLAVHFTSVRKTLIRLGKVVKK